jgi:hypothetical protein
MAELSANTGSDLISDDPRDPYRWENLEKETKAGWLARAAKK